MKSTKGVKRMLMGIALLLLSIWSLLLVTLNGDSNSGILGFIAVFLPIPAILFVIAGLATKDDKKDPEP